MRPQSILEKFARPIALAAAVTLLSGCGWVKGAAIKTVANTLSDPGDAFTSDDDPELVGAALPFGLKLDESLLMSVPNHAPLLLATCGGFTSYAYAYVETEADILGEEHHDESRHLKDRAEKLYLRARNYCLRALDVRFKGMAKQLQQDDPVAALKRVTNKHDVPLLYWTAASWGAAISLGKDQPDLLIDHPTVRALAERALALDETWDHGSIHELMITLDSQSEALGGSEAHAREHFKRAVELQKGLSPGPYIALAMGISVGKQDRKEFEQLIDKALAIDPEADKSHRLITLIAQRRARALREHIRTLFAK